MDITNIKKVLKDKKFWLLCLSFLLVIAISVGTTLGIKSCSESKPSNSTVGDFEGDGNYYLSAVDGEYSLSLSRGKFALTIGADTVLGTYDRDENDLQLIAADGTLASATVANGTVALTYNGNTYNFLKKVEYNVSYNVDGDVSTSAKVVNGKTVSKPADPVKEGHVFIGWYADDAYTTPFAFGATPVTDDITLYARFVESVIGQDEFKATYIVDGVEYSTQSTVNGVLYNLPTLEKEGAEFAGWWTSDDQDAAKLTCQYTDQVLKEDTKLYAVWVSDAPLVSVTENSVKWNALGAGVNYTVEIYVNGAPVKSQKTTATECVYDFTSRGAASYRVEVSANNQTTTAYFNYKALDRVSAFTVAEPSVLVFNAVENAEKYLITVDCGNEEHVHTQFDNGNSTNFNFANCEMQEGGIKFTVTAVANGYTSSVSETFKFERNLDALTGLTYNAESGNLQWNTVAKATSYEVKVTKGETTDTYVVTGKSFSMKNYTGEISVEVSAKAMGYNASSATLTYTSSRLVTPTDVTVNNNTIEWAEVEGAVKYNVMIDGAKIDETETSSWELPANYQGVGMSYEISVQAVGETEEENSYYSEAVLVKYGQLDNVSYADGALRWSPVGGAQTYEYTVNGFGLTSVSAGVASAEVKFTKAGDNVIVLKAKDVYNNVLDEKEVVVKVYELVLDSRIDKGQTAQYKAVGDAIDFPELSYTGYDFAGWYNVPGGASLNGAKFEGTTYTLTTPYTLYAYWTPKAYEVTLMVGEDEFDTVTVYYSQNYTLPVPEPLNAGEVFIGWNTQADGHGIQYTDGNGNSNNPWKDAEGRTLYATWTQALLAEKATLSNGYVVSMAAGLKEEGLKEITIPAEFTLNEETLPVVGIAAEAFANCKSLETINIPDTIETIYIGEGGASAAGSAFFGCDNLKNINVYCVDGTHDGGLVRVAAHETYFSSVDGVLLRHAQPNVPMENGTELYYFPVGRTGVYEVPYGVEFIPQKTFQKAKITDVIIPASVSLIGRQAFERSQLRSVVFAEAIGSEVEEKELVLDASVFAYCYSLTTVDLPARLTETAFNELTIFDSCTILREINVIGDNGFYTSNDGIICDASGREIIYCPVGRVGEVVIPVAIQGIADSAFKNCSKITSLVIGGNVAEIGQEAFMGCKGITTIEFRGTSGSLEIGEKAFYGCTSLRELELSKNVTKIAEKAFGNTPLNTRVILNAGANIDYANGAFMDDDGKGYVTNIVIGENMGAFEIKGVFSGCQIQNVTVQGENANYFADEDGVLYNADKTQLLFYPKKYIENYEIPETVTTISAGVFEGNADFESITIGANVTTIGANAFKNMARLTTVVFESRTEDLTIGDSAFEGCSALATIELPETLTSIGASAFKNCTSITSLTLPSTLTTLGNEEDSSVFDGCTSLASIAVAGGESESFKSQDGILYGKTDGKATALYFVPASYTGDVEIPKTVYTIPENAFYGHTGVTSITWQDDTAPNSLRIGDYAFAGMKALTTVTLPNGLTVIPEGLLAESSVTSVFVPNTVNTIELKAFYNATGLDTLIFEEGNNDNILVFEDGSWTSSNTANSKGVLYGAPLATSGLVLPERVKMIPDYYFANSSFTSLTISASMERIGVYAFGSCKSLTTLTFAKREDGSRANLTLGASAFRGCTQLDNLTIPNSIKVYEGLEFSGNGFAVGVSGTDSYVSKYVTHSAFRGCTSLKNLTFEEGLTAIGSGMFYGCSALGNSSGSAIVIPDSVTSIGEAAFMSCNLYKGITLGSKITEIKDYAFHKATGLTSITIPKQVEKIGVCAFSNCTGLTSLTFASDAKLNSISSYAFNQCTKLQSVELPDNSEVPELKLGTAVFNGCTGLTAATVSSNVLELNGAFAGCTKVTVTYSGFELDKNDDGFLLMDNGKRLMGYEGSATEIVIPDGVETIGDNAFTGKTAITKVTIPDSVKVIGAYAFQKCTALAEVVISENSGVVSVGNYAFSETAIVSISLPNVTSVGDYVFYKCTKLTSVSLNDELTMLGNNMFDTCSALTSITLPAELTTMAAKVFQNSGLTSITLPEKLVHTDMTVGYWFYNCKSLTSVTINSTNLGVLPTCAFYGTAIESIVVPEGVTTIADAFDFVQSLKNITFPSTLTTLYGTGLAGTVFSYTAIETLDFSNTALSTLDGPYSSQGPENVCTFSSMSSLKTLKLPATVTYLDSGHIQSSTAIETFIAPGLTIINKNLLRGRTKLTTVEFSDELAAIEDAAFSGCTSLANFNFPESLKSIGVQAFYNTSLTDAIFGSYLETIGTEAFYGTNITETILPASLTEIGARAFANCPNFTGFKVSTSNPRYYAGNYKELYDNTNTLICFPVNSSGINGVVELEDGVMLNAYVFSACKNIDEVVLPDGLYEIPEGAFADSSIKTITIPDSVVIIGDYAFSGCTGVTTLNIPANVTSIGVNAFEGLYNVDPSNQAYKSGSYGELYDKTTNTLLYFPASSNGENGVVTLETGVKLNAYAFSGTKNLTEVVLPSDLTVIPEGLFQDSGIKTITIPASVTSIDATAFTGSSLQTITFVDRTVSLKIAAGTFRGLTTLQTVTMGTGITEIGDNVFYGCTSLQSVTLSSSLTLIGKYAFRNCTNLKSIVIPYSVTTISQYGFYQWDNTQTIYVVGRSSKASGWNTSWFTNKSTSNKVNIVWNYTPPTV